MFSKETEGNWVGLKTLRVPGLLGRTFFADLTLELEWPWHPPVRLDNFSVG